MTISQSHNLSDVVASHNEGLLAAYSAHPALVREHHGIEQTVLAGGYGYRQILELVQNGADAILEWHESAPDSDQTNRIHVLLRGSRLYVANTGAPLSREGVQALLSSHSSPKRGNQIGRFGLGFKSLLALGGRIDLFTNGAGAIRMDPDRCRRVLREEFSSPDAPGLRLAWPLGDEERAADSQLAVLSWAQTIVRIEVGSEQTLEHLRRELSAFPAEFLLFLPVQVELLLDDGDKDARTLGVQADGEELILRDGTESSKWRVAKREVVITEPKAVADATHIHARSSVPVAWAVPIDVRREEAGRFWAFLPTQTPSYIRGILNAPWKLNSDRNAIIGGDWNSTLMLEAAKLVAETIPSLGTHDDPARPLDAFPRQLDRKDEAAAPLVEALWQAIENAPVVPDATGTLRKARELIRPPRDSEDLASRWQALAAPRASALFVHSKCSERLRASRLDALAKRLADPDSLDSTRNLIRCPAERWFGMIASVDTSKALPVLELVEAFSRECKAYEWQAVRDFLPIVPTRTGKLQRPSRVVFAPAGTTFDGLDLVAEAVQEDPACRSILSKVLEVRPLEDDVWLNQLVENLPEVRGSFPSNREELWLRFWSVLRSAPAPVRSVFISRHSGRIRVRRNDGVWVLASEALFLGLVIESSDLPDDRLMLVDLDAHIADFEVLVQLGVRQMPVGEISLQGVDLQFSFDGCLYEWLTYHRHLYKVTHRNSASLGYLEPVELSMPSGFSLLPRLSGQASARLTREYLSQLERNRFPVHLKFGHSTTSAYPKMHVAHPLDWFLLRYGTICVGREVVKVGVLAARRESEALHRIKGWSEILRRLLEKLGNAFPEVVVARGDLHLLWHALIAQEATPRAIADQSLGDLWTAAAKDGVVPEVLDTPLGIVPISEVHVTSSPDLAQFVRGNNRPVIILDEVTLVIWVASGAKDLAQMVKFTHLQALGPVGLLIGLLPELANVIKPEALPWARAQSVSGLELHVDGRSEAVACLVTDQTMLIDADQLSGLPRTKRLRLLLNEAAAAGWIDRSAQEALDFLGNEQVDRLRAAVASGGSLAERLLYAVGGRCEPLLEVLGSMKGLDLLKACAPVELASLVIAQLGPASLVALRDVLAAEGLGPPVRWSGTEARSFVTSLGFPDNYAIAPESRRDAEELISGPIELPPLHDFQKEVLEGIRGLMASGTTRRRAVVSLPTGGGKTRVTVEAAVRLVLGPEGRSRSVLWIAQTDELCEQAVQAFRQVWLNVGAGRTELRIVRLWGGNPNPAQQDQDKPVVVVASIQTLNSRFGTDSLAWIRRPNLVVVDECHHAVTPSYTNLLKWLDAEAPRSGSTPSDEPLILGLSATPFRTDDDETRRLARRFDGRWFPENQEALYDRLRSQGVLAQPVYEELESGASLLPEEIEGLSRLPSSWEGLDFENLLEAINQRLAGDTQRNERLAQYLRDCAQRSVIFFTNSVAHAQEMSLRLNVAGVSAAAISGATPSVARRHFLDCFQRGELRVLCNHSVLTTGFDAPKTDMILIARQVFSPVPYMQMVGRGLRGEKNGGTSSCRIVTVLDNLGRFQERHPYHYCREHYGAMLPTLEHS